MQPTRHILLFVLGVSIAVVAGSNTDSKTGKQCVSTSPATNFSGSTTGQKMVVTENVRGKAINATSLTDADILGKLDVGCGNLVALHRQADRKGNPADTSCCRSSPAPWDSTGWHSPVRQLERIRRDG